MYGNFCGPYWSNGRWQASVIPTVDSIDSLDETCREHDFEYAVGGNLKAADLKFFHRNFWKGGLATAMAIPVGIQGFLRANDNTLSQNQYTNFTMTKNKLRGSTPAKQSHEKRSAAPVAIATKRTGTAPKMVSKPSGTIEIAHRAFLAPIECSGNYTVNTFAVNPGLPGTFPWLSKVARRYEEYRFKKLRFEYRSVCATSVGGVVMMSFDYDAADTAPTNKASQAQSIPNSEVNCWLSNDLNVPLDAPWKVVRAGILPDNLDIKTYDVGNMFLSSIYGSNIVTGELYVDYVVELRRPTDGPTTGGTMEHDTTSFASPFAGTTTILGFLPYKRVSDTVVEFISPGEFMVVAITIGTGLTTASSLPITDSVSGGVVVSIAATAGSTIGIRTFKVRAVVGDRLTWSTAGTGSTISNFRLLIAQADYATLV
jgi:hypothetical protein